MNTDINKAMKSVEKKRNLYTKQIDKEIMKLYKQVGEKYSKMLEDSSEKQRDIINTHKKYLEKEYSRISSQTEEKVKSAIERMVKDTIKRQMDTTESILEKYNIDFGKDFENMFSKVNEDAVRMLVSGKVYKDKISLSERIWGSNKKTLKEIDRIISEALIEKKHPIDIAKEIEKYVNPEVRKYTDASSYKKVKSIEYNSLRLARTYISHAYQEAAKDSSEANPFVKKIIWKSSHHKNMCGLCASRDGKKYNPKDLPLDHPNGMCSFTYETDNLEDTAERLKKWMDGEEDDELDKWYNKYIGEDSNSKDKNKLDEVDDEMIIANNETLKYLVENLKSSDVRYSKVSKHKNKLNEEHIIQVLAGGDETGGSCASVGLSYIGQKGGLNVLDFRGGKSQNFFSRASNLYKLVELPGVKSFIEKDKTDVKVGNNLLSKAEIGKEYYLVVGRHASIIRRTAEKRFEYLELQSEKYSGWTQMTGSTLNSRFGCRKTQRKVMGMKLESKGMMIDVDSIKDSDELRVLLGYINTAEDKQRKGVMGSVK